MLVGSWYVGGPHGRLTCVRACTGGPSSTARGNPDGLGGLLVCSYHAAAVRSWSILFRSSAALRGRGMRPERLPSLAMNQVCGSDATDTALATHPIMPDMPYPGRKAALKPAANL